MRPKLGCGLNPKLGCGLNRGLTVRLGLRCRSGISGRGLSWQESPVLSPVARVVVSWVALACVYIVFLCIIIRNKCKNVLLCIREDVKMHNCRLQPNCCSIQEQCIAFSI